MYLGLIREFGIPVLLMAGGLASEGVGALVDTARTLPINRIAEAIARTFSAMKTIAALQKSGRIKVSIPRQVRQYLPLLIFCAIYFGSRTVEARPRREHSVVALRRAYQEGFQRGREEGMLLRAIEPPPPYESDAEDA